jgi:hypothetical protein
VIVRINLQHRLNFRGMRRHGTRNDAACGTRAAARRELRFAFRRP